ncbi:MAG: CvpA family protein [Algoriphagus sp.]|uniref:CvpA family protein n=1 Tax=Algoriphagus sp. TaxID=1872435 RepID=UPI00261B790D|nr:CvpA family protein [Algoriphagus sp.]MDG1277590.1 CvpA family protein [Algoriphagus sp.]
MEAVDIVILIILGLGAYEGFKQGFLMSIVGLVGFVIAIVLGFYFMDSMADWLGETVTEVNLGYPLVGFLVIFIITMLLIRIVGWALKQVMDLILLGGIDSAAGGVLGVVKAGFFISLFLWFTSEFKMDLPKKWLKNSEILGYIKPLAPAVIDAVEPLFPSVKSTRDKLDEFVEDIKEKVDEI